MRQAVRKAEAMVKHFRGTYETVQTVRFQSVLNRAKEGDYLAQYHLGERYFRGQGVPQDDAEAARWFAAAAAKGVPQAQSALGLMYFIGRGVSRDVIEAVKWLHLAAERGDRSAVTARSKIRSKITPEQFDEGIRRALEFITWQAETSHRRKHPAKGANGSG